MNDVERVDRDELSFSRREVMAGSSVVAGAAVLGAMPRKVAAQQDPPNEISGTVTDSSGAVEDATVDAVPHDSGLDVLRTTTDANGEYIFDNGDLHDGENLYHVIARDGTQSSPRRGQENYPFIAAEGGPVIPDSALLQFPFRERTDSTLVETQESADGTANGITNVSGSWYEGYAESGDGTDDYGDLGDWSGVNFGADIDTNWCLLFTIETTDNDMCILGSRGDTGGGSTTLQMEMGRGSENAGGVAFFIADSSDNRLQASTDSAFNDGNKHRAAINKTGNTQGDVEIWIDGSEQQITYHNTDSLGSCANFDQFVASHARNVTGSISDYGSQTLDNIIPCGSDLTGSGIQSDYNQQPWS